jgi:hypothetical protein
MSAEVGQSRVLVRSHPTIDTEPCAVGHYEVEAVEMWILGPDGLDHWRTHRSCMRCKPISSGMTLPS